MKSFFFILLTGLSAAALYDKSYTDSGENLSPRALLKKHSDALRHRQNHADTENAEAILHSATNDTTRSGLLQRHSASFKKKPHTILEDPLAATPYLLTLRSFKDTFNQLSKFYLPMPKEIIPLESKFGPAGPHLSEECQRDVIAIYNAFQRPFGINQNEKKLGPELELDPKLTSWAIRLVDSWGKSGDGILKGNLRHLGFIDECFETVGNVSDDATNTSVTFNGQYCLVTAEPTEGSVLKGLLPLQYGTCIPSSCTEQEFRDSLNYYLPSINYPNVTAVRCQQEDDSPESNTWQIVGGTIILVMLLPVLGVSIILMFTEKVPVILKSIAIQVSWRKLSDVSELSMREDSAVYGIRVLSMAWIIMGHYYNFIPLLTDNPLMIPAITDEFTFQMVWGATYAEDTFFTLSGLLTTMVVMNTNFLVQGTMKGDNSDSDLYFDKKKRAKASKLWHQVQYQGGSKTLGIFLRTYGAYIGRRLIWLLPALVLVIMYCAGPSLFFISGPFRRAYEDRYLANCRQNWWADLTFASNYLTEYPSCISSSWLVATDFQLFLVAPLILLPLKLIPWKYFYTFSLIIVFSVMRGCLAVGFDLIPINLLDESGEEADAFNKYIGHVPWGRAAPYFVGTFCALLLMDVAESRKLGTSDELRWLQLLRKKAVAIVGWVVITVTAFVVIFGIVDRNYFHFGPRNTYSDAETFFYSSFTSTTWAICISWVVVMTYAGKGNGGPVGSILSHPLWVLPSRLTYSVYVMSYPLELMMYYSIHRLFFVRDFSFLLTYSGLVVVCFLAGLFVCLVGEAPYVTLSKLLLPGFKFLKASDDLSK